MEKNVDKKYKLIKVGKRRPRIRNDSRFDAKAYRLQALRDIPEHGVKAGDLGGYVTSKYTLSHAGTCWIGGEAEVFNNVMITGDAYIGDNASVLTTTSSTFRINLGYSVRITGNARVMIANFQNTDAPKGNTKISNNVEISGHVCIANVLSIADNVKIYGNAYIMEAEEISGNVEIFENAKVNADAVICGKSKIYGKAIIGKNSLIMDSEISGDATVAPRDTVKGMIINNHENRSFTGNRGLAGGITEPVAPAKSARMVKIYNETVANIASYETDIVKIIKYPVMTDRGNPATLTMTLALKTATRLMEEEDCPPEEFEDAVKDLETKFLIAESNALKIASTGLSEAELKKTEKAKDLLAIASNEGSSENEKKVSFKQAFKQLEGVVVVPEIAIDKFRVKIGLKELEA